MSDDPLEGAWERMKNGPWKCCLVGGRCARPDACKKPVRSTRGCYAMVKCACGWGPSDAESDREACDSLVHHINLSHVAPTDQQENTGD